MAGIFLAKEHQKKTSVWTRSEIESGQRTSGVVQEVHIKSNAKKNLDNEWENAFYWKLSYSDDTDIH